MQIVYSCVYTSWISVNLIYNYNGSGSLTDYHPNLNDLRLGDRQLHDILNVQTSSFNGKIEDEFIPVPQMRSPR